MINFVRVSARTRARGTFCCAKAAEGLRSGLNPFERALGRDSQSLHHRAKRRQVRGRVELAFVNSTDDAKYPQAELESKLIEGLFAPYISDPLQSSGVALGWSSSGVF